VALDLAYGSTAKPRRARPRSARLVAISSRASLIERANSRRQVRFPSIGAPSVVVADGQRVEVGHFLPSRMNPQRHNL
jgi:hypothetical protein